MSIKIMSRVWDDAPFDGYTLLLLLALADNASDEGICWPSIETLMRKTRLPRRTVFQAIKNLTEAGWVQKIPPAEGRRSGAYRVVAQAAADTFAQQSPADTFAQQSAVAQTPKVHSNEQSAQPALTEKPEKPITQQSAGRAPESAHHALESAHHALESAHHALPPHPLLGGTVIEPSGNRHTNQGARELRNAGSASSPSPPPGNALATLPTAGQVIPPPGRKPPTGTLALASTTNPEFALAAKAIVCAHPKARMKDWHVSEVPWAELTAVCDAIIAEADRAGASLMDAARALLERMEYLSAAVPREDWRFFKPPADFFRLRDYRMEPGDFGRAPAQRSFADLDREREKQEMAAANAAEEERYARLERRRQEEAARQAGSGGAEGRSRSA